MRKLVDIVSSLLLGLGTILVISPAFLYWWIHGRYERYIWIISGPTPFSKFGSGPFQLGLYVGLFLVGATMIILAFIWRNIVNKNIKRR